MNMEYIIVNKTNGSIIFHVEIIKDKNGICASYDEGRFSENEFEFNRMKGSSTCNTSIAGKLYDYRFYPLDNHSYKYKDLLKENNITKYDYLNITDSSEVKLYYTNYFLFGLYDNLSVFTSFKTNNKPYFGIISATDETTSFNGAIFTTYGRSK